MKECSLESPLNLASRSKRKEPTKGCLEDTWRTGTILETRTPIPLQPLKPSTSPGPGTRRNRSTPVTRRTVTWRARRGKDYRRRREWILIPVLAGKSGTATVTENDYNFLVQVQIQIIKQQQVEIFVRQQEQVSVALRVPVQDRESGQQEVVRKRV